MICSKCDINETNGRFAWCKQCRKDYDAQRHFVKRELRNQQVADQRAAVKLWMSEIKESRPCADCGNFWPAYVMHWDHLPQFKKLGNISDYTKSGRKTKAIEEMKKCELVCGNCHAIRTHNRYSV